jgi:preprotein translocase subunit SecF
VTAPTIERRSLWHRLYHGETNYDFVGRRWIGFTISGVLVLVTIVSLFTRGLNFGIDFEGGIAWEASVGQGLTTGDVEDVISDNGIALREAKIQTISGPGGDRIRVQVGDQPAAVQIAVSEDLASAAGVDVEDVSVNVVSSTWGDEITEKAIQALVVFFLLIAVYISLRFEWRMAIAALVAVLHDVLISVGVYSVFQFEVTPATVIAFLTILGFSLYDTIVVFDKVHENTRKMLTSRATYTDVVNLSMNQVLMRSLNTSLAAVLPVLSLLVIGGQVLGAIALEDFSLALLVGLITGSYSSIFIATPLLAMLKEGKRIGTTSDASRPVRRRQTTSDAAATPTAGGSGSAAEPVAAGASAAGPTATPTSGSSAARGAPAGLGHAPRPRKKRRR